MYQNVLIFGKDQTEEIVSLEIKDNLVYAYFNDGSYKTQPARYFVLASRKIDNNFVQLSGESFYKWVRIFDCKIKYSAERKKLWKYKDVIWSPNSEIEMHMLSKGTTLFKGLQIKEVSRLGFDIETNGLIQDENSTIYMISNTFRDGKGNETKRVFTKNNYKNVGEMLVDWSNYVREINPTMMVAHNGIGFDLPYMNHVAKLQRVKLLIGRDASELTFSDRPRNFRVDGSQSWQYNTPSVFGRHVVDTMFLSVKFDIGRNFPSWGLKPIIEHLGLVKDGREFYDASKIKENWDNPVEREKIIQYGIDDGDDCLNLYEIMAPSFFYMNQSIPKSFQEVVCGASGSWLNGIMVRAYLQDFRSIPKSNEKSYVHGGISFGIPGIYSNMFKVDVASLYPSIMREYKISPIGKDPDNYYFQMVDYFTEKRFEYKNQYKETGNEYYNDLQASSKVFINSAYGVLGTPGLNFNDFAQADRITGIGRQIIRKCLRWASNKDICFYMPDYDIDKDIKYDKILNKPHRTLDYIVPNADTDSISICKNDMAIFNIDEQTAILDEINSFLPEMIKMEEDGYFDRVIVVKAKNYALLEHGKKKIKYKGSSFKSSTKEPALAELMYSVIESLVFESNNFVDIYNQYLDEIRNIRDIKRWCIKKSITETLLQGNDSGKLKILDAIKSLDYSVGDKVYLFNDIDGQIQKKSKGELIFKKSGEPTMIDNCIYRNITDFNDSYDKKHYLGRLYKTMTILSSVIDINLIKNYSLTKNYKDFV